MQMPFVYIAALVASTTIGFLIGYLIKERQIWNKLTQQVQRREVRMHGRTDHRAEIRISHMHGSRHGIILIIGTTSLETDEERLLGRSIPKSEPRIIQDSAANQGVEEMTGTFREVRERLRREGENAFNRHGGVQEI